jgi:serine/threonine-protein kinase
LPTIHRLHRKVALKFLPPALQQDPIARKRFIREARSAAALDHPYICHINEVCESDGQDFIVMEYVEGTDMKTLLRRRGRLPEKKLKRNLDIRLSPETISWNALEWKFNPKRLGSN